MSNESTNLFQQIHNEFDCMTPRILVIDDNPDIHNDFQTILTDEEDEDTSLLDTLGKELFGDDAVTADAKELYIIEGARHYDVYEGRFFKQSCGKAVEWYIKHL